MSALSHVLKFPDPRNTDREGLLAVGGDLSSERLLLAIIPDFCLMPDHSLVLSAATNGIVWRIKNQPKHGANLNTAKFSVTEDNAFESVIRNCAHRHTLKEEPD
jgi:leucyl/phenylalanyl-tRNA--protein transferase